MGAVGVDPGDARDEPGVFRVTAKRRKEDRRLGASMCGGRPPDPLAGKRRADQRPDVRWTVGRRASTPADRDPDLGQGTQSRPSLPGGSKCVVPVLDLGDDPVAAVLAHPLDTGDAEPDVVGFGDVGDIGHRCRNQADDGGEENDSPHTPPGSDSIFAPSLPPAPGLSPQFQPAPLHHSSRKIEPSGRRRNASAARATASTPPAQAARPNPPR